MVNLSNELILCLVMSAVYVVWTHVISEHPLSWKAYVKNAIYGFASTYCVVLVTKKMLNKGSKPIILGGGNYQENIQQENQLFNYLDILYI